MWSTIIFIIQMFIVSWNTDLCEVQFKGTPMQIWKSAIIFVFIWKYVEDFTWKHLLLLEICAREIWETFVYKHSDAIEYDNY